MTRKTATGHIRRQTSGRLQGNQDEGCEECRGVALAIYFVLGGKPYYPGAVFTFLFAAGSVPLERWLAARPPPPRRQDQPSPEVEHCQDRLGAARAAGGPAGPARRCAALGAAPEDQL